MINLTQTAPRGIASKALSQWKARYAPFAVSPVNLERGRGGSSTKVESCSKQQYTLGGIAHFPIHTFFLLSLVFF